VSEIPDLPVPVRVVLADADVLYSRVLRDDRLNAADEEVITINWSDRILEEMAEHLVENVAGFTGESAERLVAAMNSTFPLAAIEPTTADYLELQSFALPDDDDRHVLAAVIAAEANVLCTANTKDFPTDVAVALGFEVMNPDLLLSALISEFPEQMLTAHAMVVAALKGASDELVVAALQRAGAPSAADLISRLFTDESPG